MSNQESIVKIEVKKNGTQAVEACPPRILHSGTPREASGDWGSVWGSGGGPRGVCILARLRMG